MGSSGGAATTDARLQAAPVRDPAMRPCSQRWTSCLGNEFVDRDCPREILIGVLRGEGIGPEVIRCALEALQDRLRWQRRLESYREWFWPWSLNPAAWQARHRRERARRALEAQLRLVLQV